VCVSAGDVPTGSSLTAAGDSEPQEKAHMDLQWWKWKCKWKCLIWGKVI